MTDLVERKGSNNVWITPPIYVEPVKDYAPIGLDPCTEPHNPTGAESFYTEEDDGLIQDWSGHGLTYVNPPYSTFVELNKDDYEDDDEYKEALKEAKRAYMEELKDQGEQLFGCRRADVSSLIVLWAMKIHETVRKGTPLIALLPCGARFSTKYWQRCILNHELSAMCFVEGRIPFIGPDGKPGKGNLYDSIYYGYNLDANRFDSCFKSMGAVLKTKRQRFNTLDGYA